MYVRYAYQNQEAEPGTNSSSPYDGYRYRLSEPEPQHAGFVHPRVRADVHDADQGGVEPPVRRSAAQRRPPADALHESDDAGSPAGIRHRVPRLSAVEPGQRHSVRRTAAAAAVLSGPDLVQGQARLPLRRFVRAHRGRPHLRRLCERRRGAQHDVQRAVVARQLRAGPDASLPDGDQPERVPRRHLHHAGVAAQLHQQQPLQRVRALRERQLERSAIG